MQFSLNIRLKSIWIWILQAAFLAFCHSAKADEILDRFDSEYEKAKTEGQLRIHEKRLMENKGKFQTKDEWAWRMGRVYYGLGKLFKGQAQENLFKRCADMAEEALSVHPYSAPGYFYKGLCIGKLGKARGLWSSLDAINPLRENMEKAADIDPAFNHGGPHRALGKLFFELPFILGGDNELAVSHLEKALNLGPEYGDNHYFLAEAYQAQGEIHKAHETLTRLQRFLTKKNSGKDDELLEKARSLLLKLEDELKN